MTPSVATASPPPTFAHWPAAVRSAELLRGSVVRCGPGLRSVGWPETPATRAAALSPWLAEQHRVATHLTAAWIWGAARDPGAPLDFALLRARPRGSPGPVSVRLHEFAFDEGDIAEPGGHAVTTPSRTLYDLLRAPAIGAVERLTCRVLIAFAPGTGADLSARLERRRLPCDSRILARLGSL